MYADKTKLSSFGTAKGYPIVARFAALPHEIRNSNGVGGGRVVGWLPIVDPNSYYIHTGDSSVSDLYYVTGTRSYFRNGQGGVRQLQERRVSRSIQDISGEDFYPFEDRFFSGVRRRDYENFVANSPNFELRLRRDVSPNFIKFISCDTIAKPQPQTAHQ